MNMTAEQAKKACAIFMSQWDPELMEDEPEPDRIDEGGFLDQFGDS